MSAIEKMVEYLDSSASIGASRSENIRIARRLLAEEQAKKPTAPAGNIICGICPSEMERKVIIRTEKGERQVATIVGDGDLVFFQGGYRPAAGTEKEGR